MKNIPHQFSNLDKFYRALICVKELIEEEIPLRDENLGERLIRKGVIEPRNKDISIDDYLAEQDQLTASNRSYYTAARETRRFFELLGFLTVASDKSAYLSRSAIQILSIDSPEIRNVIWREAVLSMTVEGTDGELSHPYRILLKLLQDNPGIETRKLMLALESENDSGEEYQRIVELSTLDFETILTEIDITETKAKNAIKILPAIAEQLGDLVKNGNNSFPNAQISITEDDISTDILPDQTNSDGVPYSQYRSVTTQTIATDPIFNSITTATFDLGESIRKRQVRLAEHQDIVRILARFCDDNGYDLYEGKFDCLATKEDTALLFEVKTILESISDQEKQTIKGVGQLKYYDFSIVKRQMGYEEVIQYLVFSQKPEESMVEFCNEEDIVVLWIDGTTFKLNYTNDNFEL